jgi:hypothetical protein
MMIPRTRIRAAVPAYRYGGAPMIPRPATTLRRFYGARTVLLCEAFD